MSNWTAGAVGDLFDLITGYAFKSRDFIPSGVPVIKIKNVKSGYFSEHEFSYVDPSFLETLRDKVAKQSDLLISMSGNRHDGSPETWVGKIAILKRTGNYLINQRVGALRPRKEVEIDVRFFSFLLSSIPYQELFISIATSSGGQANLSPQQIFSASVRYPDLKTQQQIGALLGALDDKIDLNRRMNETLEAMARAIFKDWFVDFGPSHAKAEGRTPYLAPEIWELFPGFLDDEDKPVGWEKKALSDLVSLTKGRSYKSAELNEANTALVTLKSFQRGGGYRHDGLKSYIGSYTPEQVIKPGELVVALTDVTQAADVIGKPAIVGLDSKFEMLVASLDVGIIREKKVETGLPYLYCLMRAEEFQNHIYGHCLGTTVLHLSKQSILSYELRIPPAKLLSIFDDIASSLFSRQNKNEQESRTLAQVRNLLLPKLMSGEIRLQEAEKSMEAVA